MSTSASSATGRPVESGERHIFSEPATSRAWWFLGTLAVLRNPEGAPRTPAVIELTIPAGGSPPRHVHDALDDSFLVLDGEVVVRCGDRTIVAQPGTYVVVPAGLEHTFRVTSRVAARLLLVHAEDSFLRLIEAAGSPTGRLRLPPAREFDVDIDTLIRLNQEHDSRVVGPPLEEDDARSSVPAITTHPGEQRPMTSISEPTDVHSLAAELTGPLLLPGSAAYDEEVAGFNVAVSHRAPLVVAAADGADVQVALRYARAHQLPVGVQATGHGATTGVDAGLLISTRRLGALAVDPVRRTATVGAGVRWRQVISAAAVHGLAPLSGSSSDVSAVGYTLGGGLPVMGRTFGFAADRARAFDVVTADGSLRHVDASSDPDLFWGLCGGKGNLGIVTAMTIELVEVATVYGGGVFYSAPYIPTVLHAYPAWAATLPEQTSSSVAILRLPPVPEIPEPIRGQTVAHLRVCHVGGSGDGERLVAPMRAVAPALLDGLGDMPYTAVDSIHRDPDHPVPFCHRGTLLRELTGETVDALLTVAGPDVDTPLMLCEVRQMGGALRRGPATGNAVSGRDAAYSLFTIGLLTPETAETAPAAVDAVIAAVGPWSTGYTLVNLHGSLGDETDRARAWDPPTYRKLAHLSRRLDPTGLLRHGHAVGRDPVPVPGQA